MSFEDIELPEEGGINELYKKVSKAEITAHKKLAESVYMTEYSNSVKTVVNYSENEFVCEYGKIPPKDYIIAG